MVASSSPNVTMQVEQLDAEDARARFTQLVALLQDTVNNGASIGFLPPLETGTAKNIGRKP